MKPQDPEGYILPLEGTRWIIEADFLVNGFDLQHVRSVQFEVTLKIGLDPRWRLALRNDCMTLFDSPGYVCQSFESVPRWGPTKSHLRPSLAILLANLKTVSLMCHDGLWMHT